MRRLLAFAVALLALGLVVPVAAVAQEATPAAALDVPDPSVCTVAPRSEQELRALFRDAAATATATASPVAEPPTAALPTAAPADEATAATVNASWREFIACVNTGDLRRVFALLSDDKIRSDFVFDIGIGETEDSLIAFFVATPVAPDPAAFAPFVPLADLRMLADGRVAGVGPGQTGQGEVLIFVRAGDRWLVDDQFDLPTSGTPTP